MSAGFWCKRAILWLCCGLFCLTAFDLPSPADAQSSSSLRQKLSNVRSRKSDLQQKLRETKQRQAAAQDAVSKARADLNTAQHRLNIATNRLNNTRSRLRTIKNEHAAAQKKYAQYSEGMQERVLMQFEAGTPTYIEVLLNATDFVDFAERSEFTRLIAAQDSEMLDQLLETRLEMARRQVELEKAMQEQEQLKKQVAAQKADVERKKAAADLRLQQANNDRRRYEQQMAQMEAESRSIESMLARMQRSGGSGGYSGTWSGSLLKPVNGRLTSPFGMRFHPILKRTRMHTGIDLAASSGTPIRAADKGRVIFSGWKNAYGNTVIIDHGSGISTLYAHCSSLNVRNGQTVGRGDTIARVGSTGWSTGPHLHFEVRKYGKPVNPLNY